MYVGAVLSAIGLVSTFFQTDAIRDQIEDDNPSLSESEIDTAVSVGVAFAVVIGLATVGLWLWMAYANGRGQSWARVVATVLGGLSILATLAGLAMGSSTGISLVFSLITVVLAAVILFLLYRPESSRYYDLCSR
jgi:hypothetical protein